jgi:membrane protease YdiL (CAAX protease family)
MGTATGLIMSIIIILTWIAFEDSINLEEMIDTLNSKGLSNVNLYAMGMIYWIFINSLLEEYVFRWFITTKASVLFGNDSYAIFFSALMFTLHHSLALHFFGFIWWQTIIASFGLLSAAAIWSWLYLQYRSIWVCWLSHAICDVVVFSIGYQILFT